MITDLFREHKTLRQIAAVIGRDPATISRELRRNTDRAGRYLPGVADRLASGRVVRLRKRRVTTDGQLCAVVAGLLGKRWSPEQVAHELRVVFPGQAARYLCTESIYQAIYDPDVDLTCSAKRRRGRRRRHTQGLVRRGRLIGMRMIADRPVEVAGHIQVGHWVTASWVRATVLWSALW